MPRVLVIIGSVRPKRIGPTIALWVAEIGRATMPATFAVTDLRDWPLPMDDEPGVPARDGYVQPHTKAWSDEVAAADAFVFVTPQYNWGYPAPLKNAIDHLYSEWRGKAAAIITYGGHGGGKCAAQLREVLGGLKMRIAETMPALMLPVGQVEANSGEIDPDTAFRGDKVSIGQAMTQLNALLKPPQDL
ncbi:MAG: NAD(P)H-dependent oxidoreductase [Aquamicrobium sp.]|uniref:NADPH-dependent FMN reductase n=1 Tax=Mesorhizobium sp. Pch-S TaxID=2082387 RepID=UPI001012122F|nr:NAD(P)H-dependent oxidoreductase [Mesorhizobium sp. Pch-S]MBR2689625.1 NAD(P)H-dependent oxidoreductase [Aquamicrobium sp.]QAZ41864.1 NAD(FAD)-dependent dehydrogenase [Mesorhizobium sp. Pch-S]